ncbi:lariat debranching enzyme B-like [Saccoglossus kowalevskii]|uniref:Lariat debranching enzyme A-like n=1 Tax=Saccoglossus kowalevskii TaxID=10224 RepID=A0ABM0M9V4_SACKO|nr:PREDICTED: lariat debranching enzyme A-like [Saccoglossus kowalevskii]
MKIAIEGCAHGELEKIYATIQVLEKKEGVKVDLLLCCGDFQSVRNDSDLQCMAVPPKYREMASFYKYYSGELTAPILTIFIGGNHEASNYLSELPYGGWVCPNIYYMGFASIVKYGGIRIGGLSGIYKHHDYKKGHFEKPPFSPDTMRSIYHIRNLEVFRLKQIKDSLDIMMSHDWPRGIYHYGDTDSLLQRKPHFSGEIETKRLGELSSEDDNITGPKVTRFLALDKCLPHRDFLQVVDIDNCEPLELSYDAEWLAILKSTNHLLSTTEHASNMPFPGLPARWDFTVTEEELSTVRELFNEDLKIPLNFTKTVPVYDPSLTPNFRNSRQPPACVNHQTTEFCQKLGIADPNALNCNHGVEDIKPPPEKTDNPDEISIDEADSNGSASSPSPSSSSSCSLDEDIILATEVDTEANLSSMSEELLSNTDGDTEDSDMKRTSEDEPCQKGPKKFKRRNHKIYEAREKDD